MNECTEAKLVQHKYIPYTRYTDDNKKKIDDLLAKARGEVPISESDSETQRKFLIK